ncbi:hypothetical protein Tco_0151640 [Tanacetum coccineum]
MSFNIRSHLSRRSSSSYHLSVTAGHKTISIARAIYTHDHDLHDLPPSHGGAYGCILVYMFYGSTPAVSGKVPYLVALVALLSTRDIVVEVELGALGQISPIGLLLTSSHVVDLGDILLFEGLLLMTMVVSR